MRFRASSLHEIMGDPKTGDGLSAAAKTFLNMMAKEYVYGFTEIITSKYMDKGTQCEAAAIDLYNTVFFTDYVKNSVRKNNDWITGECDILVPGKKVIDIKNAWSLPTFPATTDEVKAIAKKSGYDWQGRAYMMLDDVDLFEIAYCIVTTPEELIRYEQPEYHFVDHIDPTLRVTNAFFERDKQLEEKIKHKVALAREYLKNYAAQISLDHKHDQLLKEAA
ncbi:MAG: hypothetical protein JWP38_3691 [Herbaspirillum sp.]|nr:hypothetical protein [Herbaspirillum sp.]